VADKVLVTNLYNHTQPLIRYELTDRFVEVPGPHPDGRLRAHVDGRHDPPFRYPGGVEVHPLAVRATLTRDPDVLEHQVLQTPTGIEVRAVVVGRTSPDGLAAELVGALRRAGLPEPTATVELVDDIPRDGVTGKPRRFVPLPG
jgi:phenylacetate-coenzyme A ligase PaaK-like adenylate-forming protein